MFRVEVHKFIGRMIEIFHRIGFWHRGDEETVAERRLKLFYSIYYFLLPISLIAGAKAASDDMDEFIFLVEAAIMATVLLVKLLYIIWGKNEILEQLNQLCDYGVDDQETFTLVGDKLNTLMKFVVVFFSSFYFGVMCVSIVVPFLGNEKTLFFKIGFPLDWRNDEFAYWMAFSFIFAQAILTAISLFFSAIIWYLMANCGLRYKVLGQQIKVMGEIKSADETPPRKISNAERDGRYHQDLLQAIDSHQHLIDLTKDLGSFLSEVFAVQLATSGLCICASVYSLAFNRGENLVENLIFVIILLYNIFDIFMVMYLGNEIQLASDRLSYSLFESDWIDRPQSIKKIVLIFGEFLMRPQQLVVFKLYPVTLETFTRIVNSAYSMFNILKNFK